MTKNETRTITDVTIILTSIAVLLCIYVFGSENVVWFAIGMVLYSSSSLAFPVIKTKVKEAIR